MSSHCYSDFYSWLSSIYILGIHRLLHGHLLQADSVKADLPAVHAGQHCLTEYLYPDSLVLTAEVAHHARPGDLHLY